MSTFARPVFVAIMFAFLGIGCYLEPSGEDDAPAAQTFTLEAEGFCTAEATCGSCTTLSCSGQSICSYEDGRNGYVVCDGAQESCQTCTFNGQTYGDGKSIASGAGVRCSSKLNGYCIGGVFAGKPCVASGECYATCCNGTWSL